MNEEQTVDLRERLVRIETKLDMLVGNGQPGLIHEFNDRLVSVESFRDKTIGRQSLTAFIAAALSTFGAELLHLFIWHR